MTPTIRQKMLFKTEWKSVGLSGSPEELGDKMNVAYRRFDAEGYQVNTPIVLSPSGVLLLGQRQTNGRPPPVFEGGCTAIEITYTYEERGNVVTARYPTLLDAARAAVRDAQGSNSRSFLAVIAHVSTSYNATELQKLLATHAAD